MKLAAIRRIRPLRRMAVLTAALALAVPLVLAQLAASAPSVAAATSAASCPWLNQSLSIGQRVHMLMAQMTLADKINMVTGAGFSEPTCSTSRRSRACASPPSARRTVRSASVTA
jgi:hypothetical protein